MIMYSIIVCMYLRMHYMYVCVHFVIAYISFCLWKDIFKKCGPHLSTFGVSIQLWYVYTTITIYTLYNIYIYIYMYVCMYVILKALLLVCMKYIIVWGESWVTNRGWDKAECYICHETLTKSCILSYKPSDSALSVYWINQLISLINMCQYHSITTLAFYNSPTTDL